VPRAAFSRAPLGPQVPDRQLLEEASMGEAVHAGTGAPSSKLRSTGIWSPPAKSSAHAALRRSTLFHALGLSARASATNRP